MKLPVSQVSCKYIVSISFLFIMLIKLSSFVMSFKPLTFCEKRLSGTHFRVGGFRVCGFGVFGGEWGVKVGETFEGKGIRECGFVSG